MNQTKRKKNHHYLYKSHPLQTPGCLSIGGAGRGFLIGYWGWLLGWTSLEIEIIKEILFYFIAMGSNLNQIVIITTTKKCNL